MKMTSLILVAALSFGAAGCTTMGPGASMMSTTAVGYVPLAAVSDTFEIETSQLALQRSRDPDVRRFARQMVRDHTTLSRNLMRASRRAGMTPPPPALDARHSRMLAQLNDAPEARFDAMYLDQQVMAHEEALGIHSTYARNGDDPVLVRNAKSALPVVQRHYEHVQSMANGAGM